jgi:GDPmannose 4,6-dehydratase
MTKALITGITGQDGSYLTELLLDKGYEVNGVLRPTSSLDRSGMYHFYSDPEINNTRLFLHYGELSDTTPLRRVLSKVAPDEIYHLAGQSHVGLSFEIPETTCEMTALGTLRLLEMIRDLASPPKFFHAASSEIFGEPRESPQNEETPIRPVNPYGCAKAYAAQIVDVYRKAFGLFACNGILFNHESPRRGENFVTRKICRAAAAIKLGQQESLTLGSLTAKRDWGHAKDYVRGMWMALQQPQADTFIFATGKLHSVQDVVATAFQTVGLNWEDHLRQDPRFMRVTEPMHLVGDATKAKRVLGWEPTISFEAMIAEMTEAELNALKK